MKVIGRWALLIYCLHQTTATDFLDDMRDLPSIEQVDNSLNTARCRARCMDAFASRLAAIKVNRSAIDERDCSAINDCEFCWTSCEMFYINFTVWGYPCLTEYQDHCLEGCRVACAAYQENSLPNNNQDTYSWSFAGLPLYTKDFASSQLLLNWTQVQQPLHISQLPSPTIVYSVYCYYENIWIEINQTLRRNFRTNNGNLLFDSGDFLIIAANRDGLLSFARPQLATESLTSTTSPDAETDTDNSSQTNLIIATAVSACGLILTAIGMAIYCVVRNGQRNRLVRENAVRLKRHSRSGTVTVAHLINNGESNF